MNPRLISFFNLIRKISSHSSGEQILCQAREVLEDLKKLLPYIPDDKEPFYDVMVTWPTTSHHDVDQSVDE
jgi:hypothetical protein